MDYDINALRTLVENRDIAALKTFIDAHDLVIDGGRIVPRDPKPFLAKAEHYHFLQWAKKILLNSLYGALLNSSCRFYDQRIGQSVTLTGRSIVRHMNAKINEIITGEYSYTGSSTIYSDTDSVVGSSAILTNYGRMSIEELFSLCAIKWKHKGKEYATDDRLKVTSYDDISGNVCYKRFNYVYRHRTNKRKFRITDAMGRKVTVTDDHSIIVKRFGNLTEVKPSDVRVGDILIEMAEK